MISCVQTGTNLPVLLSGEGQGMSCAKTMIALCCLIVGMNFANAQNKFITPEGMNKPTGYTHVVVAGNTIYVAGQVAANERGEVVGKGDLEAQTKRVFENIGLCLKSAGAGYGDIVRMTMYVVNYTPEKIPIIRAVRNSYLMMDQPPASTLVGVQALANPDYLIEIEVVAVKK